MNPRLSRALAAIALGAVVALVAVNVLRSDDAEPVGVSAVAPPESTQPTDSSDSTERTGGTEASPAPSTGAEQPSPEAPPVIRAVPELTGNESWFNSEGRDPEEIAIEEIYSANQATIVQFWTFGCRNCKATLPHLQALYDDHRDSGLEIVGIHAPEFSFERDPDNVAEAITDLGIEWLVTLDQDKRNFHRWQEGRTGYWPRTYVIDSDGNIRFDHIGEGSYDELRSVVEALLAEPA